MNKLCARCILDFDSTFNALYMVTNQIQNSLMYWIVMNGITINRLDIMQA